MSNTTTAPDHALSTAFAALPTCPCCDGSGRTYEEHGCLHAWHGGKHAPAYRYTEECEHCDGSGFEPVADEREDDAEVEAAIVLADAALRGSL